MVDGDLYISPSFYEDNVTQDKNYSQKIKVLIFIIWVVYSECSLYNLLIDLRALWIYTLQYITYICLGNWINQILHFQSQVKEKLWKIITPSTTYQNNSIQMYTYNTCSFILRKQVLLLLYNYNLTFPSTFPLYFFKSKGNPELYWIIPCIFKRRKVL